MEKNLKELRFEFIPYPLCFLQADLRDFLEILHFFFTCFFSHFSRNELESFALSAEAFFFYLSFYS